MDRPILGEFMDDVFLLKLIQQEDKQAFKYIFDLYFVSLCRFIRVYVHNNHISEEIALDIFTNVWEKKENIEIRISWKAYLFQSARNRALNYLRDNERFINVSDWSAYDKPENDPTVELRELELLIQEAVCSLPARCGEIFRKSRMEYLTNKQIADELQISIKNVEAQITKALKLIRQYLGDSYTLLW